MYMGVWSVVSGYVCVHAFLCDMHTCICVYACVCAHEYDVCVCMCMWSVHICNSVCVCRGCVCVETEVEEGGEIHSIELSDGG